MNPNTEPPPTPEAIAATLDRINSMGHYDMCALWRHAPAGHPYFDSNGSYSEAFRKRLFDHFGGFTPEISKDLSW